MLDETEQHRSLQSLQARIPCTRGDAVNVAIHTGLVAHLAVCAASWILLILMWRVPGVLWGFGVAAVLVCLWPVLVIPAGAVIGIGLHLMYGRHNRLLNPLIRSVMILYELAVFGWIVVLCLSLSRAP